MENAGSALMGIGRASGENRAIEAARQAIDSPLLELSIDGAMGILYNITGGPDMTMYEVEEASKAITEAAHPEANIIFGAIVDEAMSGEIKITVIATGFETELPKPPAKRRSIEEGIGGFNTQVNRTPASHIPNTPSVPFFGNQNNTYRPEEDEPANNQPFLRRERPVQNDPEPQPYEPKEQPRKNFNFPTNQPANPTSRRNVREDTSTRNRPEDKDEFKAPNPRSGSSSDDGDDFDVPAFIRRKLR
jgi:hypothetical protein